MTEELKQAILNALHNNIDGAQKWDATVEAIAEAITSNSYFACTAETTHYYQDRDNYPTSRVTDTETLTGDTLEDLYQKIAAYRVAKDWGEKTKYGDYIRSEFGPILQVIPNINNVDVYPDAALIAATPEWQEHEAKIAADKAAKEQRVADLATLAAQRQEARDRADFERLTAMYGEKT